MPPPAIADAVEVELTGWEEDPSDEVIKNLDGTPPEDFPPTSPPPPPRSASRADVAFVTKEGN